MATLSSFLWVCILAVLAPVAAKDTAALAVDTALNQTLLWGPYRPNLYFGVRPRIPKSLLMGLLWAKVDDYQTAQDNFRHTCEQNEGMEGYGWEEYDIRNGGRQTVHDSRNTIDLTIDFVKVPGGTHGGSWGARIKGVPRPDAPPDQPTTLIFYTALEGLGKLKLHNEPDELGYEGDVRLGGSTPSLGDFTIDITRGPDTNAYPPRMHPSYDERPLDRTIVSSMNVPPEALWQGKTILFTQMKQSIEAAIKKFGEGNIPPPPALLTLANAPGGGNIHYIQKVFRGSFEFDIIFSSATAEKPLTSPTITKRIKDISASFSQKYEKTFKPLAPFNNPEYLRFSKEMLSNLVGGIGYFYGDSIVDRSYAPEYDEENEGFWEEAAEARSRAKLIPTNPSELFTSVPSRPFFPRGFLWDEGFHLLPIMEWDLDLTLQIVKSWLNLMDEDGWIAREQILGPEARSKVPSEFQTQYPHYANPPTLFLVLREFMNKAALAKSSDPQSPNNSAYSDNKELGITFLRSIYPLLCRQYFWFRKTQRGDLKSYERDSFSSKEGYRWRGRTVEHILTSGLDDYPRAQPPHPGELHVDLISWMGMMTRSLRDIAEALGETADVEEFTKYETAILRNIDDLHWNKDAKTYCDSTIDDYEESIHVCHKGYISIFPFMAGLLDANHPRLGDILNLIQDSEELWSDYGIRSLSKRDEFFGTGENYWKGPIWINMNYLVLKNLLSIAQVQGPYQEQASEMYTKLRKNVVDNVFKEWKNTGFAWEQYNPDTGKGQRTQHFTGWTSLVVKMMTMPDLSTQFSTKDEL
ncbi:mannosyl-oligosaccharide glucosidase [Nannizzia gypsea CBS 118893]|uniref:Mannosyl-oligosaccharide glucosidase n=1 Tax=Arthroderma gypseum (strain ATCC MYA-4604 / CBS 118893) TaxID=535722 RepID=E5QYS6_ARTGP|nr:mannosyl-oligosaccharide glucosidase [Nannizzia gypsea CBS 118893]EFQ97264.1 mannosyl-oligosaccharide glucosidase [Nannizzia gypsea CBS 118893]